MISVLVAKSLTGYNKTLIFLVYYKISFFLLKGKGCTNFWVIFRAYVLKRMYPSPSITGCMIKKKGLTMRITQKVLRKVIACYGLSLSNWQCRSNDRIFGLSELLEWVTVQQAMDLSFINGRIPLHVYLFSRPVQGEVTTIK